MIKDVFNVCGLLAACAMGGIILNQLRANPLPLVYTPPQARLEQTVENLGAGPTLTAPSKGNLNLEEMRSISVNRAAVILDARPEIFYRIGHIPSALSLPRDDFESRYQVLAPILQPRRNEVLVVYCSGENCEDSRMVGDALERLGYTRVRLFRGGWSEWDGENLPEERE